MSFLFLLIPAILISVAGFVLSNGITWKEFLLQVGAQMVVAGLSMAIIYSSNTGDVEIWNGSVTGKQRVQVGCSHTYRCNCRTERSCSGSGKDRSCHPVEVCQTCTEHFHDYNWEVYNSIHETFYIDRVNRQGTLEPPRWTAVKMGEPTATRHSYTSYIKGAPGTLFRYQGQSEKYLTLLPQYPSDVHDYYHLNRLVLVNGAKVEDPAAWNQELSEINAQLGHAKQVNILVVIVKNLPSDFFYALQEAWLGGKKNDVVLVVGVSNANQPQWARVMAWTTDKNIEVKLRDATMGLVEVSRQETLGLLRDQVNRFYKRKPMADFEYLQASISPTPFQWGFSMTFGTILALGIAYLLHRHDLFDEENKKGRKRR